VRTHHAAGASAAVSLLTLAVLAGAQGSPWLEAAVRARAPKEWRIDILTPQQLALEPDQETTVLLSMYGDDKTCPVDDAKAPYWLAEKAVITHKAPEHSYTTCSNTSRGVLKAHVAYRHDHEVPPPQPVVEFLNAILADIGTQTTSESSGGEGGGEDLAADTGDSTPDPAELVAEEEDGPEYEEFERVHVGGTYTRFSGASSPSSSAGGIALHMLSIKDNVDFNWQLGIDERDGGADITRRLGWTYDLRLGVALGMAGELGAFGVAAGAGSDAISSPSYKTKPTVPPAAYLYASPFLYVRLHRCFTADIEASAALRSNRSYGRRLQAGFGIGCGDPSRDTVVRFLVSARWQDYPKLGVTGVGALAGAEFDLR
jgi:hypothetical protein